MKEKRKTGTQKKIENNEYDNERRKNVKTNEKREIR